MSEIYIKNKDSGEPSKVKADEPEIYRAAIEEADKVEEISKEEFEELQAEKDKETD